MVFSDSAAALMFSDPVPTLLPSDPVAALLFAGVVLISIHASWQDLRTRTVSNMASAAVFMLGCCYRLYLVTGESTSAPWMSSASEPAPWMLPAPWMQLLGPLVFSVTIVCVASIAEWYWRARTGRAGFGMGDIKFVAAWSVLLGRSAFMGLLLASFAAATYGYVTRQKTFAFVPWLSCSFVGILCLAPSL